MQKVHEWIWTQVDWVMSESHDHYITAELAYKRKS